MKKIDVVALLEYLLDQVVDILITHELRKNHALVGTVADQCERKVQLIGLDRNREAMHVTIFNKIIGGVKENRSWLIERVRDRESI